MHGKFNTRQRNYIILGLCSILLIMAAGYAAFRTQLNINGTSNITSEWKVLITNIQGQIVNGTPEDEAGSPSHTETTASFSTKLYSPGDRMQYTVTVENQGSIDAVLKTIETTDSNNNAILFEIDGIEEGEVLKAGEETSFTVDVAYNSSVTEQPENLTSNLEVTLNYEQATGEEEEVGNSTNIGGNKVAITESGDGLYSDEYTPGRYVYRGSNPNNYIRFNNELWRIVAKEADGTYKILRNEIVTNMPFDSRGARTTGYCSQGYAPSGGCNAWSSTANMIGSPVEFKNGEYSGSVDADSEMLTYLNEEYYNGLSGEAQGLIEDYIWNVGGIFGDSNLNGEIGLALEEERAYKWRGRVGLINETDYINANSNQELCSSGMGFNSNLDECVKMDWMYIPSTYWWSLSPDAYGAYLVFYVTDDGAVRSRGACDSRGVRPAVFLSSSLSFSRSGTESDPYIIIGEAE